MTVMLRDLMEKVHNMQEQINNLGREVEILRKNQKKRKCKKINNTV